MSVSADERVLVMTGASGGIGEGIVKAAFKHGFCKKFVLVARRENELQRVASELPGVETLIVKADVTNRAEVHHVVEETMKKFGRIDVWINNAGKGFVQPPSKLTDEVIDDMVAIGVKSVVYGTQEVLPLMKKQSTGGQIITIASLFGRVMNFSEDPIAYDHVAYGGSKAFAISVCDGFRQEIQANPETKDKIVITTVNPGPTATEFGVHANGADFREMAGTTTIAECAELVYQHALVERRDEFFTPLNLLQFVHKYIDKRNAYPK